jgi:hypothetical protein
MSDELLKANEVQQMLRERGLRQNWVIQYVGLKPTAGHYLFRNGMLPKDPTLRKSVLKKLAKLLGVNEDELVLPIAKAG